MSNCLLAKTGINIVWLDIKETFISFLDAINIMDALSR